MVHDSRLANMENLQRNDDGTRPSWVAITEVTAEKQQYDKYKQQTALENERGILGMMITVIAQCANDAERVSNEYATAKWG